MADEGLLIPIQFSLEEARAALAQLEAQARASGQRAGDGIGKGMEGGLRGLQRGLGPARQSAMFFTQALGEFGPSGRTAQTAIAGLGSAMLAATPMLAAIAAGMAIARLSFGALSGSMEESSAKLKATTQAMKSLADASHGVFMAEAARLAQTRGSTTFDTAQRLLATVREEAAARKDLAAAGFVWEATDARARIAAAQATRAQIQIDDRRTAGLRTQVSVIEMGKLANEAAWARQEQEAARLTSQEEQRKTKAKTDREATLRREDSAIVARVNAELAEEVRLANETADINAAVEAAAERARVRAIDHESNLMQAKEDSHLATLAFYEKERQELEASMPMDAVRAFTASVAQSFGPVLNRSAAYNRAMKSAGLATKEMSDFSAAAFSKMAQDALAAMAIEAAGRALFNLALGLSMSAMGNPKAAEAFAAAAEFAVVAGMGGAAAATIGATRGTTKAERADIATQAAAAAESTPIGGAREFGGGSGSGSTITMRETVYIGIVANDFESPAETARRAARVMELADRLDMTRRAS